MGRCLGVWDASHSPARTMMDRERPDEYPCGPTAEMDKNRTKNCRSQDQRIRIKSRRVRYDCIGLNLLATSCRVRGSCNMHHQNSGHTGTVGATEEQSRAFRRAAMLSMLSDARSAVSSLRAIFNLTCLDQCEQGRKGRGPEWEEGRHGSGCSLPSPPS